ncbi:hypothetical protein NCLIV_050290 [Neospora caninum Liverpool]|uniref:SRS domain-containing protein n=1 Tax=Neospora caninum (strain Liverpool) TaxID=572307 RepID=F0VKK0_NEOCL|nr:hypothetical protein NCLIV_050290 [Neospora caninum Liverpool]CBZ54601.1 hypothetical protein NCLIV_050290 [Neospora caninum Liverpool]CEL69315.1 TPA: hypothetical protein BN1204_050290 [Neospora caninum Liverpool]|eukprot:XP_003884631.1 hypothetical protein NCLIV_050290 [Neospora caninum Liverpool]
MTQNPGVFETATTVASCRRPVFFCRPLRSGLSACFLVVFLCSFRVQFLVAEQNQCTQAKSVLQLDAKDNTTVTFSCGSGVGHLYPPPPGNSGGKKVCETSACTDAVDVTLTGVKWNPNSNGGSITTASVPQASTIYVKCTSTPTQQETVTHDARGPGPQGTEEKNCTVQISIWGPPKQGSADYPEPSKFASNSLRPQLFTIRLNCKRGCDFAIELPYTVLVFAVFLLVVFCPGTCKDGDTLNLQITSANQSVTFACGANQNLTPQLFDKVCETDTCDSQALLAHTLSGASMVQHASQKGKTDTSAYTLTVPNLPDQAKTLYYKCAGTAKQGSKTTECKIAIAVAKAEAGDGSSGPSSETTTIPPEASGSSAGKWSTTRIASLFSLPLLLTNMM